MFKKFLDKKYTKLSLFLLLILISGFTFYYFVRAENPDDDKFTITGFKVTSIKDGLADGTNPDTGDEVWVDTTSYDKTTGANPGTDNSSTNGVVRTFDTIKYNLQFNLAVKDGQSADMSSPRNVIVDVIIPGNYDINLASDTSSSAPMSHTTNNSFIYGEVQFAAVPGNDLTRTITLSDIKGNNNENIEPIFIIREATDSSTKSLSDFSDEDLAGTDFNTSTDFAFVKSSGYCTEGVICTTTITGAGSYSLELYNANAVRNGVEYSVTPIAVALVLDTNGEKGIKGNIIPTTVDYTIKLPTTTESYQYEYNGAIKNYSTLDPNTSDPTIDIGNGEIMPTLVNGTPSGATGTECDTGNCLNVNVSGINDNYSVINGKYYLTTNIFNLKITRPTRTDTDVEYSVNGVIGSKPSNTLTITDKVGSYVGEYTAKVNLFDSTASTSDDSSRKPDGLAIVNTNQQFTIKNYSIYGATFGTALEDATNYLKIDNDAIKIINNTSGIPVEIHTSVRSTDEHNVPNLTNDDIKILYGFGKWTSEYFEVNTDDASCSSIDISSLSKEELMNLYGGPCIRGNENLKWSTDATTSTDEFQDEELISYGPLVVKVTYGESASTKIEPGTEFTELVYAKIKNYPPLSSTTHQIVTNTTANFENNDHNTVLYYLSNQAEVSAKEMMSNKNNFTMTNYNYSERSLTALNSTALCESLSCAITGNSILVSTVRVNTPVVKTYLDDVETNNFYYYPIEWRIAASAYTNATSASFDSAEVIVDIPDYLNVVNYGDSRIGEYLADSSPAGYKRYRYSFTEDELIENTGNIRFSVYTNIGLKVEDGIQPRVFASADYLVTDNANAVHTSIQPLSERTGSATVTVHNVSTVGLQGTTTPSYIEKGGTYQFNAMAYNNSISTSNPDGYSYNNPALYYILPYNGDSSYEELSSNFNATKVKFGVTIASLPSGYKAYYTTASSANIIDSEIDPSKGTISWVEWTNTTSSITAPTAIKIVKTATSGTPTLPQNEFFGGENGITFNVVTKGSSTDERFYNNFYIITDRPNSQSCDPSVDPYCDTSTKSLFASSRSLASIYSRQVSGFVWEDYDYTGLYDNLDNKLSNIPVSICKITTESYDPENPTTYVADTDECVADTTTGEDGSFLFRGLSEGKYYVKYIFDNEKYLVADKKVISPSEPDSNSINSKASQLPNKNIAISSVIEFDSNNTKVHYMNLGLRIKKQFSIDIKKYITNVVVSNYNGTNSYDYDNATKVTLNFTDPKNAKIRVTYKFSIENTKYFPGYVGVIADRMPRGMTFDPTLTENRDWVLFDNALYYNGLSGQLLTPGEKHYFTLVLDLDVKEAGSYVNIVAARELVLMGEELPEYDFSNTEIFNEVEEPVENNTEGGE